MGARHSRATWTSQVLLAGVPGVFPGVLPFSSQFPTPVKQLGDAIKPTFENSLYKSLAGLSEVDTPDLKTYCTKCEDLLLSPRSCASAFPSH